MIGKTFSFSICAQLNAVMILLRTTMITDNLTVLSDLRIFEKLTCYGQMFFLLTELFCNYLRICFVGADISGADVH